MCRLLGVVSNETTTHGFSLRQAKKSLAALSPDHPDGWGLAVFERGAGWSSQRRAACAAGDRRFDALAESARGETLIAHVRKKTVGRSRVANTHPFRRGRWVFAHNGTVHELGRLARRTSPSRAAEVEGETDSERYFAHLLTALDDAGEGREREREALRAAARALVLDPPFGPSGGANFLLGDGETLYAFRLGRPLSWLDRGGGQRRRAVLVASEPLTDEAWREVASGSLLALRRGEPIEVLLG